jgi:hypothetical protein
MRRPNPRAMAVPFFDPGPKGAPDPVTPRPNVRAYTDRELLYGAFSVAQIQAPIVLTEPDQLLLATTQPREGIDVYIRGGSAVFPFQLFLYATAGDTRALVDVFTWFGVIGDGATGIRALAGRGLAEKYEVYIRRLNDSAFAGGGLQLAALAGPLGADDGQTNVHRTNFGFPSSVTALNLNGVGAMGTLPRAQHIRLRGLDAYNDNAATRYLQIYNQNLGAPPNPGLLTQEIRFAPGQQVSLRWDTALNTFNDYLEGPRFEISSTGGGVYTAAAGPIFGSVWIQ